MLTKESALKGDVFLKYTIADFQDFNNKVNFDIKLKSAHLATNDIRIFYDELAKNQYFDFTSRITGPLNNLMVSNLKLTDSKNTKIDGKINFKNLFGNEKQPFLMNGNLKFKPALEIIFFGSQN